MKRAMKLKINNNMKKKSQRKRKPKRKSTMKIKKLKVRMKKIKLKKRMKVRNGINLMKITVNTHKMMMILKVIQATKIKLKEEVSIILNKRQKMKNRECKSLVKMI